MTQDLSANTLEAVRRNMTVMSFMVIVFFFAGGHIPDGGVTLKLFLSNIEFTKPDRLLYVLWVMMGWWVYRYFTLSAWSDFKRKFSGEMSNFKLGTVSSWLLAPFTVSDPSNTSGLLARHITGGLDSPTLTLAFNSTPVGVINSHLGRRVFYMMVAVNNSSLITFLLPIALIEFAFILTVFKWLS